MIDERDEGLHAPGEQAQWSESYYFNFTDHGSGLAGLTRIGLRPNEGEDEGGFLLWLPDGRVAIVQFRAPSGAGGTRIADLAYEPLEAMQRWRITSASTAMLVSDPSALADPAGLLTAPKEFAEVALDLVFEAIGPPHDIAGSPLAGAFGGIGHYDQAGAVTGTVRIGELILSLEGLGTRDHTWGVRDWQGPDHWRYISVAVAPDLALVASQIEIGGADLRGGFVYRGGSNHAITALEIDSTFASDAISPTAVSLRITDETGAALAIRGEVATAVPVAMGGGATLVSESLTRFSVEGREALGIVEHLRQADRAAR